MFNFFLINFFLLIIFSNLLVFFKIIKNLNIIFFFKNYIFFDIFALILIITTLIILTLCLFIVDNKYFYKNKKLIFIFYFFLFFIFGLVYSNNLFSFFLFYELLLIPSYFLVLKSSPNKRSKIISNYFLLWTQLGSFLVLLGLFFQYNYFLNLNSKNILLFNSFFVQMLIFFGFGIKVPLWPFHFWLSKTHVEANTGFSIFLSGILVKAAIFGLYKFIYLFIYTNNWFFLTICLISLIDASLKMCIQNDLKKLVAYSTIQEMGFMTMLLLLPSIQNNNILFIFIIFHTFISGLYFWIVDCLYKRYNSRIIYNIQNLLNFAPKFSFFIFFSIYLFMGLPLTIKFSIEIYIFKILMNFNLFLLLFIGFFVNYLCMLFFFKTYIYINFGNNINIKLVDLTKKEFIIFIYFIILILLLNFI